MGCPEGVAGIICTAVEEEICCCCCWIGHWGGTLLERSLNSPRFDPWTRDPTPPPLPNKCELLLLFMADENEEEVFNLFSEQKAELLDGCSTNWELGFGGQYRVTASCPFLEKWMTKGNHYWHGPINRKNKKSVGSILDRMFHDFESFNFLATVGWFSAQETVSWRSSKWQCLEIFRR